MSGTTHPLSVGPEVRAALVAAVAEGIPLKAAVREAGISRGTFSNWMYALRHGHWPNRDTIDPGRLAELQELMEQVDDARAAWEAKLVRIMMDAAGRVNEKSGFLDWRPAMELLKNHPATRDDWHYHQPPRFEPEKHSRVIDGEARELHDLSDEEVSGLLAADPRWQEIQGLPDASD